jgi:hypothetical protein
MKKKVYRIKKEIKIKKWKRSKMDKVRENKKKEKKGSVGYIRVGKKMK